MPHRDSIDKIATYFARVTREPFTYKGKTYEPRRLTVSPMLFRGYTCPSHCGACCTKFSLDYLLDEDAPMEVVLRQVVFNDKPFVIVSDLQEDNEGHHCRRLDQTNGRCLIYEHRPFSCDFELMRFLEFDDHGMLTQKLYGRGWNMLRIDNERGAQCEMTKVTKETTKEVVRKLYRLKHWLDYFEIKSCIVPLIKWAETGPHIYPLSLDI